MFARKSFRGWQLLLVLPLVALLLYFAGAAPVAAGEGASPIHAQTTVSVADLDVVCTPPSPITPQNIRLNGDFVINAHIVLPPSPVTPPSPVVPFGTIVTLHLDATRISGVGLADGTIYQGRRGMSQNFVLEAPTTIFDTAFNLVPSQSNQLPPSPVCPVQVVFEVQVIETEPGFAVITASLDPSGETTR